MKRKTFQYIESEVYSFHETLKEMKLIEYEILESSSTVTDDPLPGRSSVMTISSTTENKATELLTHKRYKRMEDITNSIKKVYDSLFDEKKKVIKLYYWDRPGELTWDGVATETNTSRTTAIRWRKKFIHDVAKELGEG